jgi:hypothetical protein
VILGLISSPVLQARLLKVVHITLLVREGDKRWGTNNNDMIMVVS